MNVMCDSDVRMSRVVIREGKRREQWCVLEMVTHLETQLCSRTYSCVEPVGPSNEYDSHEPSIPVNWCLLDDMPRTYSV